MPTPSEMPLYVIGHKNPDTDAICAAIGYAELLRLKGWSRVKPARCGRVPDRTAWVLKQAGVRKPLLLDDVSVTAEMICRKDVISVNEDTTFLTAYQVMLDKGVRSLPVIDKDGKLKGLLRYLDLLQLLMPLGLDSESVRRMFACPEKIVATLGAETTGAELVAGEKEIVQLVGASSIDAVNSRLDHAIEKGEAESYVVICGDRPIIQRTAIEHRVGILVVTGGFKVSEDLAAMAAANGTLVLHCRQDTATVSKLIRCSRTVSQALNDNIISILAGDRVDRIRDNLAVQKQDLFPVINPGDDRLVGVISKSDLIDPPRIQLVLVDHNEYSQAIDGVENAEVIEVIDHHRLAGDLISREPIRYLNEPVGSTSTLVAREFRYAGIEISPSVALCLIAGMVSDTLNLSSPTTSDLDRELLPELCKIAGVDADQFTLDFFESGSLLAHATIEEAIEADRKVFEENGAKVSISHVEECGLELFAEKSEALATNLDQMIDTKGYNLALLIVTDITSHYSVLLASGDQAIIDALPFTRDEQGVFQAPGVVSRKKQIFPAVCQAIRVAAAKN